MLRDPKLAEPTPYGAHAENVAHPSGSLSREIELAIFKDHRYSFFYWLKWTRRLRHGDGSTPPALVAIDWHRDLAPPSDQEKEALLDLEQQNMQEVSNYTMGKLDPHNDNHLLSALWLNLVGDVFLLKNYGMDQEENFSDNKGNRHQIMEFREFDSLESTIRERDFPSCYLDIDLDYFIHNKVAPYQRSDVQRYRDERIQSIVDPNNQLFTQLLPRLEGITLATEPRYCGGVRNSNHILNVILHQLFTQQLDWKHLV